MRLLQDVSYRDQNGQRWLARAGDVVDGASIPRFFWRIVGSPFVGLYRRASVLHDVYCQRKEADSKKVHAVFWEMMRTDGVSIPRAAAMWCAVRVFGPRFRSCCGG